MTPVTCWDRAQASDALQAQARARRLCGLVAARPRCGWLLWGRIKRTVVGPVVLGLDFHRFGPQVRHVIGMPPSSSHPLYPNPHPAPFRACGSGEPGCGWFDPAGGRCETRAPRHAFSFPCDLLEQPPSARLASRCRPPLAALLEQARWRCYADPAQLPITDKQKQTVQQVAQTGVPPSGAGPQRARPLHGQEGRHPVVHFDPVLKARGAGPSCGA